MKKFLTSLATLFLIFGLILSCAGNPKAEESPVKQETAPEINKVNNPTVKNYNLNQENVKLLGRSYFFTNFLWMPYSSTGAEFNIKAKRLDVTFIGDSGAKSANEGNAARVVVFVNGERKLDELIRKTETTFTIFDETDFVEGVVQILKVSEVANSTAAIECISLDPEGSFSATAPKDLKIEFIGDSITCGYGVDDLNRNNHFKTSTEDNTKTYAYKTAKKLDADYSMVSISGWGIVSGYSGNGNKQEAQQLPKYYEKLGYSYGNACIGCKPQLIDWDFSQFIPDFIVINLGTNDNSYTKGDAAKIDEYKAAYMDFLKKIRSYNADAHIICSLGIMGQDLCEAIEELVVEYKAETGDKKVSSLKFANQNMADGIAADWHPSEKTHEKAAVLLTKTIRELLD